MISLCLLTILGGGLRQAHSFSSTTTRKTSFVRKSWQTTRLYESNEGIFYNDFESYPTDFGDRDDDDFDTSTLGDWRSFRMNLARQGVDGFGSGNDTTTARKSKSEENEAVLRTQSPTLAEEYASEAWAHVTSTPEIGGLLMRMPVEVEIYRNQDKEHVLTKKLHDLIEYVKNKESDFYEVDEDDYDIYEEYEDYEDPDPKKTSELAQWYGKSRKLVDHMMDRILNVMTDLPHNAKSLGDDVAEMLQITFDHQESWQEVCLVVEFNEKFGTGTSLVLNRPMSFKLTEKIAKLVLQGSSSSLSQNDWYFLSERDRHVDLGTFLEAFGDECAVYVGGPDKQDERAMMLHGIAGLEGSREIAPGAGIYRGGLAAAIEGIRQGQYQPLDFRFFVGRHEGQMADQVASGKVQPIAVARTLALKQCISLPKPLWHEVLELCGGDMKEISDLELGKQGGPDEDRMTIVAVSRGNDVGYFMMDDDDEDDYEDDDDDDDDFF